MNNEKLIKAINAKGLSNSLISIYYNIGRALHLGLKDFQMEGILNGIGLSLLRFIMLSREVKVASMEKHTAFTIEMVRERMRGRMIQSIVGVRKKIQNLRVCLVRPVDRGFYWIF